MSFPEPVLVTGAAGRLGRQIVQRLVARGVAVVATDRVEGAALQGVEFVKAGGGERAAERFFF